MSSNDSQSSDDLSSPLTTNDERPGWTTVGQELRERDPETFDELNGIARDILRSLRARSAAPRSRMTPLFGPRKVKPSA